MKQETFVISFLSELVRTPASELDAAITKVLGRIGALCEADRAYVFLFRSDDIMDNTHEWVADGVAPMQALLQNQPTSILASKRDALERDEVVHIPMISELPDSDPGKATLVMQDIQSLLMVPIHDGGRLVGFAGLDRTRREAPFEDVQIQLLRAVGDVIQSSLMRRQSFIDLEHTKKTLEQTLAALPDLLLEVDMDGVYRAARHNRATGWFTKPQTMIGKTLEEVLRPEIAAEHRRMMAQVTSDKAITGIEQQLEAGNPDSWVEVSVSRREGASPEDPDGYLFVIRDISERKAQEAELVVAQAQLDATSAERDAAASRLNDISGISDDWLWEQDQDGRFTYISQNITRFGVTPEQLIGQHREDVLDLLGVDPQDSGLLQISAKIKAQEPFRDLVYKACGQDGNPAYFRLSASPVFAKDGSFTGYRGVGSDVTDLRLREEAAHETAGKFEAIMAAMPDLLIELDEKGCYTGFVAGPHHLRVPVDGPLEGLAVEDVLPPHAAKVARDVLVRVLKTGRIEGVRYPLEIAGARRVFELSAARKDSLLPDGRPTAILLIRDVSNDTAQREELMKMGKIVEAMTNFVVVLDRDRRVVWFNRAFAEKSGWSLDEVRGKLFKDLVRCPESDPDTAEALEVALSNNQSFRGETVNQDRHGNRYVIDFNVQPLFGIDGELQGYVTVETDITEHKRQRVEVARLAAEANAMRLRLENALNALPDSVIIFDAEDRLVIANDAYRKMFSRMEPVLVEAAKLEDILRHGLVTGILPGGGPDADIEAALAERMRIYAQPRFADEVELPNGRWVRRINVRTSDGGCITVAIDITDRRNEIKALDAANAELTSALAERDIVEKQLTKVMEGAAIGTWEWNATLHRLTVAGQWRQILGYDEDDMPPLDLWSFRKLVHPDDLKVFDTISTVHDDNATALSESEFRMLHKDGHWVWVLSRSQITQFAADGSPEIIGGVHLNISDRKKLEQDLEAGKTFLEQVMDASIAAIVVMNGEGNIIYANSEAERILRLTRDEITNLSYNAPDWSSTRLDGSPIPDEELPFSLAIAQGSAVRDVRFAIQWRDGTRRCLSVNAVAIHGEDDELRVVTSFNDVTEELAATSRLEQARAQAEGASRSKSMFLANMSHEIRTPLNGVLGMAEVLEGMLTEERQRRMIGTIRNSGETLLSILNDILDMSKIEAGKMELEQVVFVVDDVAQSVQALNAIRAEEKGLEFRVHTNSGCALPLLGDPHRISQILNNLLHNAIKFTENGRVTLTMQYDGDSPLEIVVTDTGIGMTQAQISRMLESFEQADGSITRRFGGTGLGMSIVKQLVGLMKGEISIESEPGKGTSIRVTLPLTAAEPVALLQEAANAAAQEHQVNLGHMRVLVADDSPTNRLVIEEMLSDTGISIAMVENGREAVDIWTASLERGQPYDIVLMDISMPVLDGVSAVAEMRAHEEMHGIAPVPIIAVTANAMPHQVADYLIAGFDTHLAKPFKRAELVHAITILTTG
ncbi:MAG: PAS domain S-box protein [Rhodobacterales bacterium]|nr:PAS domain S-box protein [Rhodobacterales bacterium]MDX5391936.1 PAS domain S-box protein [Rhodobacterales bacterium]MDX5491635.1 PAS domain S-box protein [Rhodobacterales bacterium]